MSQPEHVVTFSEDWIAGGLDIECTCGWIVSVGPNQKFAEEMAQRHYQEVKEQS